MGNNIYQSPSSNLSVNDTYKGSPVKAVLISSSVDIIGSMILGVIYAIAYGVYLAANGATAEQIDSQLTNIETFSIAALIPMLVGFSISIYAGYLCAKIANHNEFKIASIFAAIVVIFSVLVGWSSNSIIENIGLNILNLACIFTGVWLHVKKKHNK